MEIEDRDINNAYQLTNKNDGVRIVIEFVCLWKKVEVLKNCSKLHGSKIFINKYLTPREQEDSYILWKNLKLAKKEFPDAYIKQNKLFVGDNIYTVPELKQFEEFPTLSQNKSTKQPSSASASPYTGKRASDRRDPESEDEDEAEGKEEEKQAPKTSKSSNIVSDKINSKVKNKNTLTLTLNRERITRSNSVFSGKQTPK